jgi:hypothetical protein
MVRVQSARFPRLSTAVMMIMLTRILKYTDGTNGLRTVYPIRVIFIIRTSTCEVTCDL